MLAFNFYISAVVQLLYASKNLNEVMMKQMHPEQCRLETRSHKALVILTPALFSVAMIRHLKHLTSCSFLAVFFLLISLGIILYYCTNELPTLTTRRAVGPLNEWPLMMGAVMYAFQPASFILTVENVMQHPDHLLGTRGLANITMLFTCLIGCSVGFLGYLKFGENVDPSVSVQLPDGYLSTLAQANIALSMFFSYPTSLYIVFEVIWKSLGSRCTQHPISSEYCFRALLVTTTLFVGLADPHLGAILALKGALCLTTLGFVLPGLINTAVLTALNCDFGPLNWKLARNLGLVVFGAIWFGFGVVRSIKELIADAFCRGQ